jgi:cysteinyl-tRNA synthetase
MHNNMITVNGRKMGKSYNNYITLSDMFSGNHPLLTQPISPMTIRFFILQSHYRSTLDFSSEALVASEKAFKRLWESYEILKNLPHENVEGTDEELNKQVLTWLNELEEFMDDDLSTARVIANLFELAPVINSIRDKHIAADALPGSTIRLMQEKVKLFMEDILGLENKSVANNETVRGVMDLLMDIRKEAKDKKDFVTSDKIRNKLGKLGVTIKDEKDGSISWNI